VGKDIFFLTIYIPELTLFLRDNKTVDDVIIVLVTGKLFKEDYVVFFLVSSGHDNAIVK